MRRLLLKAGVPLAVGAMALTSFSGAASANAKHPATSKPTFTLAYEGPLSGGNAQLGLNMSYSVQYAINRANSGSSQFGQPSVQAQVPPEGRPGLGHDLADRRPGTRGEQLGHRRRRPGVLRRDEGRRADVQCQPPCDREPIGDPTDARELRMEELLPSGGGRQRPGTGRCQLRAKVLHKKDIYVANDASTYGVGLANAFANRSDQGRRDGYHRHVPRHYPVQRWNREPDAVPRRRSDLVSKEPAMLFYGGYYCDLGLLLGALHSAGY